MGEMVENMASMTSQLATANERMVGNTQHSHYLGMVMVPQGQRQGGGQHTAHTLPGHGDGACLCHFTISHGCKQM